MQVELLECPSPFIEQSPCQALDYYVYRIMSGTEEAPEAILIRYDDNTFRILNEDDYEVVE